jgi:excisionase family DNA binding protein
MEQEQVYTPDEVAKMLKVHVETVRRAIRNGELKAAATGAGKGKGVSLRISRIELARWWQSKGGGELFEDLNNVVNPKG